MRGCVVAGIGTEVGKTVVAAIFVERLRADYWKPVQAGSLDRSDTMTVRRLAPGGAAFYPEAYRLRHAMSPHAAAELEGVAIEQRKLALPQTANTLVVELAGGLMVPLGDKLTNIDLLPDWDLPVVLVANYYLGSINHTLLSLDALTRRNISVMGLVFNGDRVDSSRRLILAATGLSPLLDLERAARPGPDWVARQARKLQL